MGTAYSPGQSSSAITFLAESSGHLRRRWKGNVVGADLLSMAYSRPYTLVCKYKMHTCQHEAATVWLVESVEQAQDCGFSAAAGAYHCAACAGRHLQRQSLHKGNGIFTSLSPNSCL